MTNFSISHRLRALLLTFVGVSSSFVLVQTVLAVDPAAPYRNMIGFRCFYENARGECFDFLYGGRGTTSGGSTSVQDGDITVEIGSPNSSNLVRRGTIAEFRIILTNDTNDRITTDVRAELDSDMAFSAASLGGEKESARIVEWSNVRIDEDDTEELILRVRIASDTRAGDTLTLRVETEDGSETELDVRVTNSSVSTVSCGSQYFYIDGRRVSTTRVGRRSDCDDDDFDDEEGEYSISISDTPDPFEPGQLVIYTITVRNEDNESRRIDVRATLDPDTDYVSASDSPEDDDDDEIVWEDLSIGRDSSRTLTLRVRSDRGLDDGDVINLTVEAGTEEEEEDTEAFFP